MCTARELKKLVADLNNNLSGQGSIAELAAQIFDELNKPTDESGTQSECSATVREGLKTAEENCLKLANWFRAAREALGLEHPGGG